MAKTPDAVASFLQRGRGVRGHEARERFVTTDRKLWLFDPATNVLVQIARHDRTRFGDVGVSATAPFNQDEESSGVIDVSAIYGTGAYLLVDQAHYAINAASPNGFTNPDELVEGGQLLLLHAPLATNKDQCKSAGWEALNRLDGSAFKNQGDCIQYVNTGK